MQRYFVPEANWNNNEIKITGEDVHHIRRVMRFQTGNKLICNHPDGKAAVCKIESITEDVVQASIIEWLNESTELPITVTIAQALPKGDKLETVLQKGTELGASSFIPVQAERSIVVWDKKKAAKKLQRYAKIVKEASEQSHRNIIPQINPVMTMKELVENSKQYDVKIFAYEDEAKSKDYHALGAVISQLQSSDNVLVCIGPEGGFSEKEVAMLRDNAFTSVRLGPRILRTETAALYVLASISYQHEELRCK